MLMYAYEWVQACSIKYLGWVSSGSITLAWFQLKNDNFKFLCKKLKSFVTVSVKIEHMDITCMCIQNLSTFSNFYDS